MPVSTTTKVLLGVGAAGIAGFAVWALFFREKKNGGYDVTPSDGWGGYDMSTGDEDQLPWKGSVGTSGPEESNPLEQSSFPRPQGMGASPGTTPGGPDYTPSGPAQTVTAALGAPRVPLGHEPNKQYAGAFKTPCAGVVCPPNHVCMAVSGKPKCIPIE